MKIFQNKSLFKKLMIIFLIIMIFSFCVPKQTKAVSIGGKLLQPIVDLILSLTDGVYGIAHKIILQQDTTLIHIDFSESVWEKVATAFVFIVVAVATVAAIIATAGAVAALIPALASIVSIGLGTTLVISTATGAMAAYVFNSKAFPEDELILPLYSISPEEIFSNDLVIFDVDYFNPEQKKVLTDENGEILKDDNGNEIELESTSRQLRSTVSNWYNVLRDISLVTLLSVLVYIGIRIIISSTSGDKAKYKQMLMDWVVAICLLFTMQYIMSFSNLLVEKITDVLKNINYSNNSIQIIPDKDDKVSKKLKDDYGYTDDQIEFVEDESGNKVTNSEGENLIYWHTNLMGIARLNAQMGKAESSNYAGYTVMFMVLVFFTLFFIFTYLKRVIYMAFLTLIAPLVAMTYPLDKINDGKAQAFNMWFKEYIFNLLIQPMHLILYTILVTSAFELASKNMIYSLVALGFMIPAEKLLRKFFGFEKAQTPGLLAGPAGAAATMGIMNKLLSKGGSKGGKSSSGNGGKVSGNNEEKFNIKMKDDLPEDNGKQLESKNPVQEVDDKENIESNKILNSEGNSSNDSSSNPTSSLSTDQTGLQDNPRYIEDSIRNFGANAINNTQLGMGAKSLLYNTMGYAGKAGTALKNSKPISWASRKIKNRPRSRIVTAGANAFRYYARGMKNKLTNKIKNGHPVKAAIRTVGGMATGAVAASLGLATGIVSGDLTKTAQYTTAAALGGSKLGETTLDTATNALSVEGTKEEFENSFYGKEGNKERQIQKNIKEAQRNFEIQNALENNFGKEKAKELKKTVLPDCVRYGIEEPKDIVTVAKLCDEGVDKMDAIRAADGAKKHGDTYKLDAEKSDNLDKTLLRKARKNKNVKNEEQARRLATDSRNMMDRFTKIRSKI